VLLDGAAVGAVPLSQVPLTFGAHRVTVKAAGYHPVLQEMNVTKEEPRQLKIDLQRKSKLRAALYSLLLPGMGQRYSDRRGLGYVYSGVALANVGIAAFCLIDHQGKVKKYDTALSEYDAAASTSDANAAWDKLNRNYSDYKGSLGSLKISLISAGIVWGLNVLDAVLLFPGAPKVAAAPNPKTGSLDGTLRLTFNW